MYMYSQFHVKIRVRCPADHLQRRTAPVRYVTMQEKNLKNRPVPGRLSNSPVMCKSLKSYDVSFICDHSIIPTPFYMLPVISNPQSTKNVCIPDRVVACHAPVIGPSVRARPRGEGHILGIKVRFLCLLFGVLVCLFSCLCVPLFICLSLCLFVCCCMV